MTTNENKINKSSLTVWLGFTLPIGLLISLFVLGSLLAVNAANIKASGSGNWNSTVPNAPWPGGNVPGAGDNVTIDDGYDITVTANATCDKLTIKPDNDFNIHLLLVWETIQPEDGILQFTIVDEAGNV